MKKVIIYSNMAPSSEINYAGVFVNNQYHYLKELDKDNSYEILTLPKTFTSHLGSLKKYISFIFKSIIYFYKNKSDIIHLHYFFPLAILPWIFKRIHGTKIILTIHGSDLYAKMSNNFIKSIYRYILKDYDYVICVGEQLSADYRKKLDLIDNKILCAGIDRKIFNKQKIEKEFDFLFVGTLINRKGFDIVLTVIKETVINYNCTWCVVGTGDYKEQIEDLAKQFPKNCIYYKKLDQTNLNLIYNKSKWLYFPSRNEPFGLVASECIFAGTPVISSNVGGLKEQVENEINGYLLEDFENVNHTVNILSKVSTMPDEQYKIFVDNCLLSNDNFSLKYVCENLINIYDNV